jgi:hypothetical protein
MPQHGNDEIEMVGVQAGHETAHTCSADLSRPAGSPPTGTGPSMSVPSGTKCRAWSAARSTPKAKSCPGDLAPARSVAAQARSAACRSRPTTPARASAVSTSIACLSNRTSSESLSQKQPQAAQPAHTCGKPPSFGIPKAGMPGGGRPNSDPRYGGGGRGFQNRARYGVLPTAAQPRGEPRQVI